MGKNTDKLYITHSEWAGEDKHGASGGVRTKTVGDPFRRLPFTHCALSLQPFTHPLADKHGNVFDLKSIMPWIRKHGTNPVTGEKLESGDLTKLNFTKNDDGEYIDPVTFKVFTNSTHLVAIKQSGNVYSYDTVERLNLKPKQMHDLVSGEAFTRKDLIVIQDPMNLENKNMSNFSYLKENGGSNFNDTQQDKTSNINLKAMGSSAKILAARDAVARARQERENASKVIKKEKSPALPLESEHEDRVVKSSDKGEKKDAYNTARYTTGEAAASLTSTSVPVNTAAKRATLTDEEFMLRVKRVKIKGYAQIKTNLGTLSVELDPEYSPKTVYNFVKLAEKGYYDNTIFHRNIRNFMIQGGDPTGTGRGGESIWKHNFEDEFNSPYKHEERGILSMANKGKNTNSSQFFITYRRAPHLDHKHTIFGKVVGGMDVLDKLELVPVDSSDRPVKPIKIQSVTVYVDPFDEFLKTLKRKGQDIKDEQEKDNNTNNNGSVEDATTTWTGKKVSNSKRSTTTKPAAPVGKYLKRVAHDGVSQDFEEDDSATVVKKKPRSGVFNFDTW